MDQIDLKISLGDMFETEEHIYDFAIAARIVS